MPSKHARRMIEVTKGDDTMTMKTVMALAVAALTVTAGAAIGQTKLDPDLAPYKTVSGVSGNVSSVGSGTPNNLMTHWAESFPKFYPNAQVQDAGKYGFFKEHTLKNGDYKDEVKEQPGSASVVQGITVDRYGIGYSGIGYGTAGVRAVPLAEKDGGKCVEATADNAYSGSYPLARFLYVYVNKAPGKPLDPLTREFVKLIVSREGQEGVVKDGYFPITATIAKEEQNKIQ